MKKHISLILVLTLLLTALFSFGSVALAATTFTISPDPASMAQGGTVTFNYVIRNDSGQNMTGVIFCSTLNKNVTEEFSAGLGDNPGSFTMEVPTDYLDKTLTFTYSGIQGTASVAKKQLITSLKGSAVVPRTLYGEGETVKFEFKLENQGESTIDNIVVTAPELNGGKALNDPFSLAPTQSQTKKFSYTMAKDITVNPVVSYTVGGVAQAPLKLDPVALTQAKRDVKTQLTASNMKPAAGEEVTFTLTLTNGGNVPYTDIKVLVNGEAKDYPTKLDGSATQSGTFKMTFQTTTEVSCSISLKDHTGAIKNINSNTLTIDLPVDATAVDSKLGFTMSVDRPQLTSAGAVNFSGMVTNGTAYDLTNVKITEATLGEVFSADTLAAGSTATVEVPANINATASYSFVLTATDKDGNAYTKTAEPVTVTVQSVEASATPGYGDAADVTATLAPDGNLGAGSIGTLGIIAIILVVLIIGVGVTLVVLWKKGQGPKGPSTPGRRRPAAAPARKRPMPQKNYRDRNNF